MARKRLISPEFFTHADLYDAEVESGLPLRLAFAGLWTASDKRGLFRWRPRELKLAILPYDAVDFAAVLDALESSGFVMRYVVDGKEYGKIPSFADWQTFHPHEKPAKDIPEPPETGTKPTNGGPRPTKVRPASAKVRTDPSVTVTVTGTVTDIAPQTNAALDGDPESFDLAPYADDWQAEYGGPIPAGPNAAALKWLEKRYGRAETRRRWRIYLAATQSQYASAQKLKAGWGQWDHAPAGRVVVHGSPHEEEASRLWNRYKGLGLLRRLPREEYERIGAERVAAGEYPSLAAFLDELRVTQPWGLGDARTDGYAIGELAKRLAVPRKVVA